MNFFKNLKFKFREFLKKLKDQFKKSKGKFITENTIIHDGKKAEMNLKETDIPKREKEELEIAEKIKKPYIKKKPHELGKKEINKKEKKEVTQRKKEVIIDLGKISPKSRKPKKEKIPQEIKKVKTTKKFSTNISRPFIELNFAQFRISLVIPKQIIKLETTLDSVVYPIHINKKRLSERSNVKKLGDGYYEVEKKEIEIIEPLENFHITYPNEFKNIEYSFSYYHKDTDLYIFTGKYKNRAKMIELSDKEGNLNLIPKKRVWILHPDKYQLDKNPSLILDIPIWDYEYPQFIDLRKDSYILLKNKEKESKKYLCGTVFNLMGNHLPIDDYDDESPLFVGKILSIVSPEINPEGWIVWLQNKEKGEKVIDDNWTGNDPLVLNCPEDLLCECGFFQIDICSKGNRVAIGGSIFFRYISHIEASYPRDLIIPDTIGHKLETINIKLNNRNEWILNTIDSIKMISNEQNNEFIFEIPKEFNDFNFSIMIKKRPETKIDFEISIPRLKWKIGKDEDWTGKLIRKNRDFITPGIDLPQIVKTNDFISTYKITACLKVGDESEPIQEVLLKKNSIYYSCNLNQFFDTILTNYDKLTLFLKINNEDRSKFYLIDYLVFPKKDFIKELYDYLLLYQNDMKENAESYFRRFCAEKNVRFSIDDFFDVLTLAFRSSLWIENPGKIFRILSEISEQFKVEFIYTILGLFKNIILHMGSTGLELKNRMEYLKFRNDFQRYFELPSPRSYKILKRIKEHDKALKKIIQNRIYFNQICQILKPDIPEIENIILKSCLKLELRSLIQAQENLQLGNYYQSCKLSSSAAFHMLMIYYSYNKLSILEQPNQTISHMYFIAFSEEINKFLDSFKSLENKNIELSKTRAEYAYKTAEKVYKKIKASISFLDKLNP